MAVRKREHMEDDDISQFYQLQKSQVLHEAKAFNDTPLDNRKCCSVLTELLCLLSQGEVLGKEEATTLFFGVTKLFQSQDPQLRRLVYLVIKELNKNQDDAFIVISSLEKDITGNIELCRANALRVHSQVIDSSMLEQRARLFRQAIVNKNSHIASSALCAGIRMYPQNRDVVKRWQNETREASKSSSKMVSFHALHLLYRMCATDRRAVARLVTSMISRPPESPLARCLLIRYAFSCIAGMSATETSSSGSAGRLMLDFIKDQIKQYKNPMVMFEAAKCLCHLPGATESDLTIAMNVLQEFLNSPRPVQRFAAVRALSSIVNKFANILSPSCTVDLEHLITDGNRNIATLAITTLLQTTAEYSIERLLGSITEFMAEIADELKIVLVTAIEKVCAKFPGKFESLLNFLAMALREEGGYAYKNKIVDCMLLLMRKMSRAKEFGLDSLCEFIEDCEYPLLSVRILHLIGELGPKTTAPARYIRFIFNRVLLELPCVRAAAVSCLARCAVEQPRLKNDIYLLLQRSLADEDDEVRDRATMYSAMLKHFQPKDVSAVSASMTEEEDGYVEVKADNETVEDTTIEEVVENSVLLDMVRVQPPPFSLHQLESSLLRYLNDADFDSPFGDSHVKAFIEEEAVSGGGSPQRKTDDQKSGEAVDTYAFGGTQARLDEERWNALLESKAKSLPDLGTSLCVSSPQSLTEPEAEYQVECIKRVYSKYVVLQFNVSQSIESQLITDVYVDVDYDEGEILNVTAPVIKCDDDGGIALAIIERGDEEDEEEEYAFLGKFECVLKFMVKDDNEDVEFDDGEEDEYTLNNLKMTHRDYVKGAEGDDVLSTKRLKDRWGEIGRENESRKKGVLGFRELQPAIEFVVEAVGLSPVENSHRLEDEGAVQHGVNLIAYTDKGQAMCMRAAFVLNDDNVSYKAAVRCENELLRTECLGSF